MHEISCVEELAEALAIMRAAYEASAQEYSMTAENCPYRGRTRLPLEVLAAEQGNGYRMYLYEQKGRAVGFLSFRLGDEAEISDLCVRPENQSRGIGGRLLAYAVDAAKEAGCTCIRLGMIHDNLRLREWYERFGFRTVRTRRYSAVTYTVGTMELKL